MESLNNQYGYDAVFIDKPPELYQCTVCQLVLRDPVMILKCGHRYCRPCFEWFTKYAKQMGTELRCPADRDLVDLSKVCDDHGLRRAVGKLIVKCGECEHGCSWQGELSELEHHKSICEYQPRPNLASSSEELKSLSLTVNVVLERLGAFERKFDEKEKEIAYLNHRFGELEEKYNLKCKEVHMLKKSNEKLETELLQNKKDGAVAREKEANFEKEINELKLEHEKKFKTLEDELMLVKNRKMGTDLQKENAPIERRKATIKPKEILFSLLSGDPQNVKITGDHHVYFTNGKLWATVVDSDDGVPINGKGFFEVTFEGGVGYSLIGWATENFLTPNSYVGYCSHSYGIHCQKGLKAHKKQKDKWGVKIEANSGSVLGVAIDVERGEILFGADGNWDAPMGVAFSNISNDIKHFPAISGVGLKLFVNFGQVEFKFGPPHPSFKKVIDL